MPQIDDDFRAANASRQDRVERQYPPLNWDDFRPRRPISFIVVHFSDEIQTNFLCSKAAYDPLNEVVVVDNQFNLRFSSLGAAINSGINRASHDLIAVVHEDVLLQPDWQYRTERSLARLEQVDPHWGLAGPVGTPLRGSMTGHWSDPHQYVDNIDSPVIEVSHLDEQLLLLRKSQGRRFDENMPSIHVLGRHFIRQLRQDGAHAYVVDTPTIHKYADATGQLILEAADSPKIRKRKSRVGALLRECSEDFFELVWGVRPRPQIEPRVELRRDIDSRCQNHEPLVLTGPGHAGTRLLSALAAGVGVLLPGEINPSGDSLGLVESAYKAVLQKFACPAPLQSKLAAPTLSVGLCTLASMTDQPWGVKLPELTLLLDQVLAVSPHARFTFIVRDPIEVGQGRIHPTANPSHALGSTLLPHAYRMLGRAEGRIIDDPPAVHAAITCAHQLLLIRQLVDRLPAHQCHVIPFRSLIKDPGGVCQNFMNWLGHSGPFDHHQMPVLDPSRACPGLTQRAREAAEIAGDSLSRLGDRLGWSSETDPWILG